MLKVILELANNHCGSIQHGHEIIEKFDSVTRQFRGNICFGFKFQFRNLDSFIHPQHLNSDHPGVTRFIETKISLEEFDLLINDCLQRNFIVGATPFDEDSVSRISEDARFSFLKIASCSITDWPLLEKIKAVALQKSIIASTGGCHISELDRAVSFLRKIPTSLELMHCIAIYPSARPQFNLAWIDTLKKRYRLPVGLSTHEDGAEDLTGAIALAIGAKTFEKHVSIPDVKYPMNRYSSSPEELEIWLERMLEAKEMIGNRADREELFLEESAQLDRFRRGVFVGEKICLGSKIDPSDLKFQYPLTEGQVTASEISKFSEIVALEELESGTPLLQSQVKRNDFRAIVEDFAIDYVGIIKAAHINLTNPVEVEISHHYGPDKLNQYGIGMITVVNDDYCKKFLVMRAQQSHPAQFHRKKTETFILLSGNVVVDLDGEKQTLNLGEPLTIKPEVVHSFRAETDSVIEELSTTHMSDDSFYLDEHILSNKKRKSFVTISTA
ncbi:MAG: N-acetylneuraminate synthase family protein [Pseudomonadota bacterium]|nr:N-acetylneuraminate synthase family protein [Pseudomonadota bacterium]